MSEEAISTIAEPLAKSTTADDLLAMYAAEESANGNGKAVESDVFKEAPAATAEPEPQTPVSESPKDSTIKTPTEMDVKVVKASLAGQDVEIPLAAEIVQKINGKDVTFKTQDAIQAYVKQEEFNRNMDRRLSKVAQREQSLEREMSGVKEKAIDVVNAALKGDFLSSIRSLAQLAAGKSDLDVVTFEKAYLDQLEKHHAAYSKMTPEQRDKFLAERKASAYEEENKRLKATTDRHTAEQELLNKVFQLCEENKIDQNEFRDTFIDMSQKLVGEGKRWKNANEITPEDVISQIRLGQHYGMVFNAAKKLGFKDTDSRFDGIIDEVVQMTFGRDDITPSMIEEILDRSGVLKVAPTETVENLNRKAHKAGSSPQASSTKKEKKDGGYDEMDLDELYRHAPKQYKRVSR